MDCNHKPKGTTLGYIAWMDWAEKRRKAGERQKQCKKCGLWLFPDEMKAAAKSSGEGR